MLAGNSLRRSANRPITAVILLFTAVSALALVAAGVVLRQNDTGALFTNQRPVGAAIGAARIFSGERVTPAFSVSDNSSGAATDGSSANAFGNDGRYFLSRVLPAAFAADRYLDFDFNGPLPAGLTAQTVAASVRLSSDLGTGTVCVYFELRRASTNALLSSHGTSATPSACTSGTTASVVSINFGAVTTTDVANDLRLRMFARDTSAGALRLDEATISGQTPYSSWTLYPILTRESYSGQIELLRWGLAGP